MLQAVKNKKKKQAAGKQGVPAAPASFRAAKSR
jgi:hypothetical protein